jgi:D-alanyl-lipoteichoic acid acyltransferase DltB (MBOAT superfamily)
MLFNSIDFAVFLPVVFFLYWFLVNKNIRFQNILIVVASYVFYGWWDWRFLFLIFFSTVVDYTVGRCLLHQQNERRRKILLLTSICINLVFLGFFKYCNFFIDNFAAVFSLFGKKLNISHLRIILPVGISFYTFQTLSYSIDVYKRKIEPTKDFIAFAAFVSFFPQLVAGPIERAANLLPQFHKKRIFEYNTAVDGSKQILWGLFKKIVVADNCAVYANWVFNDFDGRSGSTLVLGALFFTFQIYGDFSGYSDIAIGTSRLFGFNLMKNFAYPYFSRNIAEFWRRWHISLTTWFKDYVYIPLGGNRRGIAVGIRNTFLIFLLSGFWHGANWTFVVWGLYHALLFLPLFLLRKKNTEKHFAPPRIIVTLKTVFSVLLTFILVVIGWVLFRADTITAGFSYLRQMFSFSVLTIPVINRQQARAVVYSLFSIFVLVIMEWINRNREYGLKKISSRKILSWCICMFIALTIVEMGGSRQEFIYFQF